MAGTFKTISDGNIQTTRNTLNQLVDFVAEDVSGSQATGETRKKFQVFVTGGFVGTPGVTSSLFQTVFDQNYTLQTSNEIFDLTMGLFETSDIVTGSQTGTDAKGKLLFSSQSVMMREKISVYQQFAQLLLGDASAQFSSPFSSTEAADKIDAALFVPFKRLFVRDGIKRETFAMRFFRSGAASTIDDDGALGTSLQDNIMRNVPVATASAIFTDLGSATSIETSPAGGGVGNIVNASNTNEKVGLLFYDYGIAVLDIEKATSGSQKMSGSIDTVGTSTGKMVMGSAGSGNPSAKLVPDFLVSASMDNILDHFATVRFGTGSATFMTFQNNTFINSTLYFCRATADEFNFSTNPTYTDANGNVVVISSPGIEKSFTFVTTVGLYNANEELLAVAKMSRPIMKNDEKDLTFRVRLDF